MSDDEQTMIIAEQRELTIMFEFWASMRRSSFPGLGYIPLRISCLLIFYGRETATISSLSSVRVCDWWTLKLGAVFGKNEHGC